MMMLNPSMYEVLFEVSKMPLRSFGLQLMINLSIDFKVILTIEAMKCQKL